MRISLWPFRLGSFPVRFINTTPVFLIRGRRRVHIHWISCTNTKVQIDFGQIKFPNLIHLITNSITRDWLQNWLGIDCRIEIVEWHLSPSQHRVLNPTVHYAGVKLTRGIFWREFRRAVQSGRSIKTQDVSVTYSPTFDSTICVTVLIYVLYTKTINWQPLGKVNERTASITHVLSFGGWSWIRSRTGSHRRSNSWRWRRHLLLMFIAARHRLAHAARLLFQLADH